jgi:hypothetical protein
MRRREFIKSGVAGGFLGGFEGKDNTIGSLCEEFGLVINDSFYENEVHSSFTVALEGWQGLCTPEYDSDGKFSFLYATINITLFGESIPLRPQFVVASAYLKAMMRYYSKLLDQSQ